jgi:hypothetical protein
MHDPLLYALMFREDPPPDAGEERHVHAARKVRDALVKYDRRSPDEPAEVQALGQYLADWEEAPRYEWSHKHDRWTWRGWPEMADPVSGEIAVAK